ncbi:MAG: hypothetical protein PSV13_07165, partial [Lacunisphaera sp.]|nr:hypothetical protein [Lacunisphaera sp.]
LIEKLIVAAAAAAAEWAAVRAAEARRRHRPGPRGLTLRPGAETPLWNELVRALQPHLRRRGSKAQLARLLGLHRQRVHECLKAGSASLDAERTLLLLGWLGFFQRGGELTPMVRPGRPPRRKGTPAVPGNL